MFTDEQKLQIEMAKEHCAITHEPTDVTLRVPFLFRGKTRHETKKFTYEFEPKGVPYPKPADNDDILNNKITILRGNPGVFLSSAESDIQQITDGGKSFKK